MGNKDSYGYIDKSGEFVIPQKYSSATDFNTVYGIACVMYEGHWGVIDRSGAEIVPFAYDKVVVSDDGYVLAEKGGKCGIYASSGKLVYPIECDSVEIGKNRKMFKCGVAVARINGVRVQIDDLGNLVWQYPTLTEAL
ncbi:MAG: WG repeat-containing protein [Prevotella sp.]|nr:WG repeat-containing protein [Prevotella sp.]